MRQCTHSDGVPWGGAISCVLFHRPGHPSYVCPFWPLILGPPKISPLQIFQIQQIVTTFQSDLHWDLEQLGPVRQGMLIVRRFKAAARTCIDGNNLALML